jgi:AcrR family transcriptional regulator
MVKPAASRAIKQERAQKTRAEILSSAIDLFARRGILATTMADLARAIKMTPGALYWHFPTKEDLLLAAVDELHQRFVSSFEPLLEAQKERSAAGQLGAFVEHMARFLEEHKEHGIFFGMVGAESAENNERIAAALRKALEVYATAVENIVKYGQTKTKEFRTDVDSKTLANAIIFGNVGLLINHNLFRASLSYVPLVQALNGTVLAGMKRAEK